MHHVHDCIYPWLVICIGYTQERGIYVLSLCPGYVYCLFRVSRWSVVALPLFPFLLHACCIGDIYKWGCSVVYHSLETLPYIVGWCDALLAGSSICPWYIFLCLVSVCFHLAISLICRPVWGFCGTTTGRHILLVLLYWWKFHWGWCRVLGYSWFAEPLLCCWVPSFWNFSYHATSVNHTNER